MPKRKLDAQQEAEIFKLVSNNMSYSDVASYIYRKYGTDITIMSVCNVVKKMKKYLTPEFVTSQMGENERAELSIATSLSATLEIIMEMYENMVRDLKAKMDSEGLKRPDFLMLNAVSDRLMRLRQILFPSISVSKEISFTKKDVGSEYNVKGDK
jgi:hypothetical protein